VTLAFGFIGCKKEAGKDNPDGECYLKIKIDGKLVTLPNALYELGVDLGDDSKTNFNVVCTSADMKQYF